MINSAWANGVGAHDECCENVLVSARNAAWIRIEGVYRWDGFNSRNETVYRRVDANGEPANSKKRFAVQHGDNIYFVRNPKQKARKFDKFVAFHGCLEDSDKDMENDRQLIEIDTSCHTFENSVTMKPTTEPPACENQLKTFCPIDGKRCAEPWLKEWINPSQCPEPECTEMNIVESWRRGGGTKRRYGFILQIHVPTHNNGWSVVLRFPRGLEGRGAFQAFNSNIWNLYQTNGEVVVVLHQLYWPQADTTDKGTVYFIADHLTSADKPSVLFHDARRIKNHGCFSGNQRMARKYLDEPQGMNHDLKSVTGVRFKHGSIRRVRQQRNRL